MSLRAGHYALLILIAGLVFFLNLGVPPLWDRDEPRNAGCAVEMLARGDWVVPVFNGELRSHKPVLLYWLMMSSYAMFGVGEFGARFWSALLGIGTVLLTYEIGRCLFDRRAACWAGIVLATTVMLGVAARAATPDSVFIFCGTLALAIFVHGVFREDDDRTAVHSKLSVGWLSKAVQSFRGHWEANVQHRVTQSTSQSHAFPQSNLHVVGMYAAMGLAVLAKGPIGLILPMAVIGMYLLITKLPPSKAKTTWSSRWFSLFRPLAPVHFLRVFWSMRPLTALASALAVALPWYLWVTLRTDGAWTREFFLEHNVGRALQPLEGHSGPAILFYVGVILVGFFPWSVLTVATALRVTSATRQNDVPRQRQAMIFLLCWVGVYVGLFSLAQTKLPSYVTPCYPALALLVSYFVSRWTLAGDVSVVWIRAGLVSLLLVGVGLSVGLTVAAIRFAPGSEWVGLLGCVPILGGILCWRWLGRAQHGHAAFGLAGTAVAFCVLLMAVLPVEVGKRQRYVELLQATHLHTGPLVAFGHLEPSWVFYGGRSIHYFAGHEVEAFKQFLNQHADTWVITTRQRLRQLRQEDAGEFDVISSTRYFLRNRQLVLARLPQQLVTAELAPTADDPMTR